MSRILSLLSLSSAFYVASAAIDCSVISKANNAVDASSIPACDFFQGGDNDTYLSWYESKIDTKYYNHVFLQGSDPDQPEDGVAVHWRVDDTYAYLAFAARATGWVAFGISEAGGMLGADMVIFHANRPNELVDAYSGDERQPLTDDCSSDWEWVSSNVDEEGGFLMVETKRLLNTDDVHDRPIVDDSSNTASPHRVIAAWGDSDEVSYHGLKRARGGIRFFGTGDDDSTFMAAMESADGSVDMVAGNYTIPAQDTTYETFCFSRQDLIDQGLLNTTDPLNIIGWEPIIQSGNEAYVHHYIVQASLRPFCDNNTDIPSADFTEMTYVWAPGEKGIAFPDFLGMPLFGSDGFQAFEIQIHYNNPTIVEGVVDNSGVRFYWTSEQREQQVGIMNVGDPTVGVYGTPIGAGLSMHQFECPGSCSSLANQEVTVLREYLHMHQVGLRITNEQIRDGNVVRSGSVDFWEFDQNGNLAVQEDIFIVKPGDSFKTTCYYDDVDGDRIFGLASSEEMCMAFLYYYPRQKFDIGGGIESGWFCGYGNPLPDCQATFESRTLQSKDELNREFANQNTECQVPPSGEEQDGGNSGSNTLPTTSGWAIIIGALWALMMA